MVIEEFENPLDPATINYTVQDLIDDYGDISTDSDFIVQYVWTSDAGCVYTGQFIISLTAITFSYPQTTPVCQGLDLVFTGGIDGSWYIDELLTYGIDPTDIITLGNGDLLVNTGYGSPVGEIDSLVFTDGCTAIEYNGIHIMESPQVAISNILESCIHDPLLLEVDPGNSQYTSIAYFNDEGEFDVPISAQQFFDPSALGVTNTQPGILSYIGFIDTDINGVQYTCTDTSFSSVDFYEIPESGSLPDFCEGIAFEPELCSDPLVNSFELFVDGVVYTECPLNFEDVFGPQDYDLILFYGTGCQEGNVGEFNIQQALSYDFFYEVDVCAPQVEVNIDLLGGQIESISFNPGGVFIEDELDQTIILPVTDPLDDQGYSFEVTIDDGGCTVEQELIEAEYIAPIEPFLSLPDGESYCSPAMVPFDLTQIGSATLDSVIFIPGDGSEAQLLINDYTDIEHLYESPLDSSVFTAVFILFNPCDVDTVEVDLIVNPPVFSASIDDEFHVCQGDTIDLTPTAIGAFVSSSVIPSLGLTLDLFDINEPFMFIIPINQEADTFQTVIELTPECGDAIVLTTTIIIDPLPQSSFEAELNCFDIESFFQVSVPQTNVVYTWIFPDGSEQSGSSAQFAFLEPGDQLITLQSLDVNGCSSSYQELLDIPGFIPLDLSDTTYCGPLTLNLSAEIQPDESSEWQITGTNSDHDVFYPSNQINHFFPASLNPDSVLNYLVTVVRSEGNCSASDSMFVDILPIPKAQILITENLASAVYDPGDFVQLELCPDEKLFYSSAQEEFSCQFALMGDFEECGSPNNCAELGQLCIPFDFEAGRIELTVVNQYGCIADDDLGVTLLCYNPIEVFVPNAFSPDNDLLNEFFRPIINPFDNVIQSFDFRIFNRFGCEIWQTDDRYEGWNGNSTQTCYSPTLDPSRNRSEYYSQDEVYTWSLEVRYQSPRSDEFTPLRMFGSVTLIR